MCPGRAHSRPCWCCSSLHTCTYATTSRCNISQHSTPELPCRCRKARIVHPHLLLCLCGRWVSRSLCILSRSPLCRTSCSSCRSTECTYSFDWWRPHFWEHLVSLWFLLSILCSGRRWEPRVGTWWQCISHCVKMLLTEWTYSPRSWIYCMFRWSY